MSKSESFVSVIEAAEALKVTDRHIRNLIRDKLLPAERVGRSFIIRRADLAAVPRDRKRGPKPKPALKLEPPKRTLPAPRFPLPPKRK